MKHIFDFIVPLLSHNAVSNIGLYSLYVSSSILYDYYTNLIFMKKKPKIKIIPTPYDFNESIGCLLRMVIGPSTKNPLGIKFIDKKCRLNSIEKKVTIGFVGDILGLSGRSLQLAPDLKEFIKGCDVIVGNLETTITHQRLLGLTWKHFSWKQDETIVDALKQLSAPDRLYLSIANNHSGDFGESGCRASSSILTAQGIHVFGFKDNPFTDIHQNIRIWTGTMWSNMICDHVAEFDDLNTIGNRQIMASHTGTANDGIHYNICFPHWGYEMELFPRQAIVDKGRLLLEQYDMVIGHHPHVPQPIVGQNINSVNKLIAYSLGDFSFGSNIEKYLYGEVITVDIGPNSEGKWLAGNVNWSFTKCVPINKHEALISLVERTAFHPEQK